MDDAATPSTTTTNSGGGGGVTAMDIGDSGRSSEKGTTAVRFEGKKKSGKFYCYLNSYKGIGWGLLLIGGYDYNQLKIGDGFMAAVLLCINREGFHMSRSTPPNIELCFIVNLGERSFFIVFGVCLLQIKLYLLCVI